MSTPPPHADSAALKASKVRRRRLNLLAKAVCYLVLLIGGFTFMLPLAWMVSTSLKSRGSVFAYPPEWIPRKQVTVWAPDGDRLFKDAWGAVWEGRIHGRPAVVVAGHLPGEPLSEERVAVRIVEPEDLARESVPPSYLPSSWFAGAKPRGSQRRVFWYRDRSGRRSRVAELYNWPGVKMVLPLDEPLDTPERRIVSLGTDHLLPSGRRVDAFEPVRELDVRWDNYSKAWNALQLQKPWLAVNTRYALRIPLGGKALQIGPVHFGGFHIRSAFTAFYLNSVIVAVLVTLGQVLTSSLAAYAFARLHFPGRDKLFLGYLGTLMVPYVVTMIPVFVLLRVMDLVDTYAALILPAMFSAYGTFMLRQFFLTIPTELEDAARIDGCGKWGIYTNVILPLSKPALATLTTFVFLSNWNSFMWPLIVISSPEKKTLPIGLYAFMGQYDTQWTLLMAASLVALLPVLLVFVLGQRYFVRGIVMSGLKG